MDLSHPAADLLGASQASILQRLAAVSSGLTGRRISELSGVPNSTTQRILGNLEEIGLVDAHDLGPSRLHQLNRSHVLWDPVERMLAAPSRIEQIIADAAFESVGDRASVSLYGSTARGEANRQSDTDIVIVWGDDVIEADREALVSAVDERVSAATGNPVEIVDLSRADVRAMVERADPLIDSWRADAKTLVGTDLKQLIRAAS